MALVREKVDDDVIQLPVKGDPESARHRDRRGCLPLHLALAHKHLRLEGLAEAWPESNHLPDPSGLYLVHAAAASDAPVDALLYLALMWPEALNNRNEVSSSCPRPRKVSSAVLESDVWV
jgi:hypothetical protein